MQAIFSYKISKSADVLTCSLVLTALNYVLVDNNVLRRFFLFTSAQQTNHFMGAESNLASFVLHLGELVVQTNVSSKGETLPLQMNQM